MTSTENENKAFAVLTTQCFLRSVPGMVKISDDYGEKM